MNWKNISVRIVLMFSTLGCFILTFCIPSHATVYFYYDAESGSVGNTLPQVMNGINFEFSTAGTPGTVRNVPLIAKQGSKYFGWTISANQHDAQCDIRNKKNMPFNLTLGTTYYLAYYFNYTEINGVEVYRTNVNVQECADKGVELVGNGLRWAVGKGSRWSESNLSAHTWTHWLGNPTHHLNPEREHYDAFLPNQSGYNAKNWHKCSAGRWYGVVLAIKMAKDNTGTATYYVDGVKISEYRNIKTVAAGEYMPTIDHITINGTLCQPMYNTSAHVKNYDALILTDSWEDIVKGGYVNQSTPPPENNNPSPPGGLKIISGQ